MSDFSASWDHTRTLFVFLKYWYKHVIFKQNHYSTCICRYVVPWTQRWHASNVDPSGGAHALTPGFCCFVFMVLYLLSPCVQTVFRLHFVCGSLHHFKSALTFYVGLVGMSNVSILCLVCFTIIHLRTSYSIPIM